MGILERYQLILFHAPVLDLKAVSKVNRQELGGFLVRHDVHENSVSNASFARH